MTPFELAVEEVGTALPGLGTRTTPHARAAVLQGPRSTAAWWTNIQSSIRRASRS